MRSEIPKLGCTPTIPAVGIGRTHFEASSLMLKAMAQRRLDQQSELEIEITESLNQSGIGSLGLGGTGIKKKLYLPNMSDGVHGIPAAFRACGLDAEVMPEPDEESLKWGRRYTSGRECYPAILTTGVMVKVLKREGFDPKRSAFFMPSGNGPCRFGQYNRYHRLILDELGFQDVPVYAPDQDGNFYRELNIVEGNFPRLGWWGIAGIDLLEKRLREVRPYEKNPGDAEKVYWEFVHKVCDAVTAKRFPEKELREAKEAFRKVPVTAHGGRA